MAAFYPPHRRPLVFVPALLLALASRGRSEELSTQCHEKAKAATVEILINGHLNGSGWIADSKGLVMTAGHMLESPNQKIEVLSPLLGRKEAKVVAVNLGHDLSLLSIEPRKEGYPVLKLAEKCPPPGATLFLIGAPLYRHGLLARGTLACAETGFEYYGDRFNEVVYIAATVPRGMSGGPWLNAAGEALGVQSGVMSQAEVPIGVAFASPLDAMRTLLERRKTAATPSLGLIATELWTQERKTIERFAPRPRAS